MPHFAITLAYDGSPFVGWQRQATGTSVQGVIEDALEALDERHVDVAGAGRTDAGVHALGQVASFTLRRDIDPPTLIRATNARLPPEVRVIDARTVPPSFHARFSAVSKTYLYRIWNGEVLNPFERALAWHLPGALDMTAMQEAAHALEGEHDFAAFQATGAAPGPTLRVVTASRLSTGASAPPIDARLPVPRPTGCLLTYEISGSGFLRHMVRGIVGTLVEIGRGRRGAETMAAILRSRDRRDVGQTAPAHGLFLMRVDYDVR
jgi:tRNA pseudouridine38-40 synthase